MIRNPEQDEHVAASDDNRAVAIQEDDVDFGHASNTLTISSIDSSPSPSRESLRDNTATARLAIPVAGPVNEDPDDEEEENAKDVEQPKMPRKAATVVNKVTTSETNNAIIDNDTMMNGDGTNIKMIMMRRGWRLCMMLTCFAFVLITAAVVVSVVHGTHEGKPPSKDADDAQDVIIP